MSCGAPISVVILTHNEIENLDSCLDSLSGVTDDIHVLDSGSTDGTVERAEQRGVHVHHNPFTSFGAQRNWAIDHIDHKYDWAFHLDADERFTDQLAAEVSNTIGRTDPTVGYFVANRLMFQGQWLRHAGQYPTYQLRLFHLDEVRFEDHGHGQREVTDGPLGYLHEPYLHFGFSKGLENWFQKHASYAHREAVEALTNRRGWTSEMADLFTTDRVRRRRAVKSLSYRLPLRPQLRWIHTILWLGGILDGRAGFTYARMLATYEAMISLELQRTRIERGRSKRNQSDTDPMIPVDMEHVRVERP